jgi:hypothetical protein
MRLLCALAGAIVAATVGGLLAKAFVSGASVDRVAFVARILGGLVGAALGGHVRARRWPAE